MDEEPTIGVHVVVKGAETSDYDIVVLMHKKHKSGGCRGVIMIPVDCSEFDALKTILTAGAQIVGEVENDGKVTH